MKKSNASVAACTHTRVSQLESKNKKPGDQPATDRKAQKKEIRKRQCQLYRRFLYRDAKLGVFNGYQNDLK